jgi:hypothetical protein
MNSRSVALQGFGFGTYRVAVQGFGGIDDVLPPEDDVMAVRGSGINAQAKRIVRQNKLIIDVVVSSVVGRLLG